VWCAPSGPPTTKVLSQHYRQGMQLHRELPSMSVKHLSTVLQGALLKIWTGVAAGARVRSCLACMENMQASLYAHFIPSVRARKHPDDQRRMCALSCLSHASVS
jgi:hypothetical protein